MLRRVQWLTYCAASITAAIGLLGFFPMAPALASKPTEVTLPQVQLINQAIEQQWRAYELTPAEQEEDGKWCRRVYLDLVGRIPSYEELLQFMRDRDGDKREKLVNLLLEDSRYTEEFANHWSSVWSNILIGRSGGTARNSFTSREGMAKYLRDCFATNRPYNRMVYELVTATGTTKPGTEGFNGAVNFLADKVNNEDATLATSSTSRVFLGQQVQCTQCHNHPFNQWKQQKFWEFNAFFRQTRALRRFSPGTRDVDFVELVDQDFAGESGVPAQAEIYFEERNGLTRVAFPVFIDGTEIEKSGYVSEVNRRTELGKMIVSSQYLDKMIVNRMWSHFLGYGFSKPLDDLGPHTVASHPELLETLGQEFRKSSYDMRALMKWIVLSRPYQLSTKITSGNEADDPAMGEPPQFSHFYLRQMSAEQLYQSLIQVGGEARGSLEQQQVERDRWLNQFVVAFGTDEGDEATTFNGSIPQALMMFNGDLVKRATSIESGSWLGKLAQSPSRMPDKVSSLFIAGLARPATAGELKVAAQLLQARKGRVEEALQDLWWAILNSNEFILVQ
ncbi:hypothetical protein Q31a_25800 [Aureliella helgolandensis]|uniref:DUF1549 domain-containing protein n=2 Tax=Aureliella helgolandensis TaxID=2527968 RepID=A0A518G6R1_9BACT|nr:hypothetical protein Q31a_25800 [Aureliella helgolandensis]